MRILKLLFITLFMFISSFVMAERVSFSDFSGGVRNDSTADVINANQSPDCENVIVSDTSNSLLKRRGFELFSNLTDSSIYACQGFGTFIDQSTGDKYLITAHGVYVTKTSTGANNTDFITDRTTSTTCYDDYALDDKYIYGCNGYDYNWYYDGTTVTDLITYSVTGGNLYFDNDIYNFGTKIYAGGTLSELIKVNTTDDDIDSKLKLSGDLKGFTDDATYLYTCIPGLDQISKIDVTNNEIDSNINVGDSPQDLIYYDANIIVSSHIFVANYNDNDISVIYSSDSSKGTDIAVSSNPISLEIVNDSYSFDSVIVSTVATYAAGVPYGLAFANDYIWAVNFDDDSLTRIDINTEATNTHAIGGAGDSRNIIYAGTYLFVTAEGLDVVKKVNATTGSLIKNIVVGDAPYGMAFDGTDLWVTNSNDSTINKIDISAEIITATVTVGGSPSAIAFDGINIWVSNISDDNVNKIDISAEIIVGTVTVGTDPYGMAFDGTDLWVSNAGDDTINKIDISAEIITATVTVGNQPRQLLYDGTYLWVSNFLDDSVNKIEVSREVVVGTVTVGTDPYGMAFDGTDLWVSSINDDNVNKIDSNTDVLYCANYSSNNVTAININTLATFDTISVDNNPIKLEYYNNSIYCLNASSENISIISVPTNIVSSSFTVGTTPKDIHIKGTYLWCSNYGDNNITVYDLADNSLKKTVSISNPLYLSDYGDYIYCIREDNNMVKIDTTSYSATTIDNKESTSESFPKTFTHAFFKTRYWLAGSTDTLNKVWHSVEEDPTNLDYLYSLDELNLNADSFTIGAAGEKIVKLFTYADGLLVFKTGSIYKIIGDETPFSVIPLTNNLGCVAKNSIVEDSGILYFFGSDNYYYSYNGSNLTKLSQNIKNSLEDLETDTLSLLSSKWYKSKMYTGLSISTNSYNDYHFVLDAITGSWWKNEGIYPYDFNVINNELYIADSRYGVILKQDDIYSDYDAETSTDVLISAYYYTRKDYLQDPITKKALSYLSLAMKKQTTGSLLIDYLIHDVTARTLTYPMTGTELSKTYVSRYPVGEQGYYYQWKFYNSIIDEQFEIYNFSTDYKYNTLEVTE